MTTNSPDSARPTAVCPRSHIHTIKARHHAGVLPACPTPFRSAVRIALIRMADGTRPAEAGQK